MRMKASHLIQRPEYRLIRVDVTLIELADVAGQI